MSPVTGTIEPERSNWKPSAISARRAAERAIRAAAVAFAWAERSGAGQADAAEAARLAAQAREAADRAAGAAGAGDALHFSRMAEALAARTLEADRRVSAAVAASLWAAEDARVQFSFQPAA